ncbi:MAG: flagellar motor protein [Vampirovibrio sp.]|nr:flagellar motor protein [Vampirovibrio sp.]
MDLASVIGLTLGLLAVIGGALLEGLALSAITQPTAFIIVVGGTTGACLLAFPPNDCIRGTLALKGVFLPDMENSREVLDQLVAFALKARKEGILALQNDIQDVKSPFMKKGLELMTDGTDPHLLRELLETELGIFEEEQTQSGKLWESFGGFAPTVGIIGAVLGLIHVMENLNDPSKLGGGIAVAFVATVYGVGAANLLAIPIGSKIKFYGKQMVQQREMMIEGILSIQAGESPSFIGEKLKVFLGSAGANVNLDEGS